jgi:hypothetical protein
MIQKLNCICSHLYFLAAIIQHQQFIGCSIVMGHAQSKSPITASYKYCYCHVHVKILLLAQCCHVINILYCWIIKVERLFEI